MKTFFFLLNLLLLIQLKAFSEEKLEWLNPLPQGYHNLDVSIVDENVAYVAGTSGLIFKTTDGGMNWETIYTQPKGDYYQIKFFTEYEGFLMTSYGKIYQTVDGGHTWTEVINDQGLNVSDIHFVSRQLAFGIAAFPDDYWYPTYLAKTTDEGKNWELISRLDQGALTIRFFNENCGYYYTGSYSSKSFLFHTSDGGQNWDSLEVPRLIGDYVRKPGMYLLDSLTGIIVGTNSTILKFYYGGWYFEDKTTYVGFDLFSVYFADEMNGWTAGYKGTIMKTTDGGENWTKYKHETEEYLRTISFANEDVGIATGYFGAILVTNDGGRTWINKRKGILDDLSDIYFLNDSAGWAVSANGAIIKTEDKGKTWLKIYENPDLKFQSVHFKNSLEGLVIGDSKKGYGHALITSDGGHQWEIVSKSVNSISSGIKTIDNINIWSVSLKSLFKSSDGGLTWKVQYYYSSSQLTDLTVTNDSVGYLIGHNLIQKTTNGGDSWFDIGKDFITYGDYLKAVHFKDELNGIIIGGIGMNSFVMRTTDGGVTWKRQNFDNLLRITEDLEFYNEEIGCAIGPGCVFITYDFGYTWKLIRPFPYYYYLYGLSITRKNDIYICGQYGTILKLTPDYNPWIESTVPNIADNSYNLSIFPNPASDFITINGYEQASPFPRAIGIYNVLGEKVYSKTGGEQADQFPATIDISGFIPGIYYVTYTTKKGMMFEKFIVAK